MNWILGRLACGSLEDATALSSSLGITAVLTLSEQKCLSFPVQNFSGVSSIGYAQHKPIPDEVWLPPDLWESRVECLQYLLASEEKVLVHCRLGLSRAPALCAAYLIRCGMFPFEALAWVQEKRLVVKIHPETWRGVTEWAGYL